jgi:SAM-dependent methyltransferase
MDSLMTRDQIKNTVAISSTKPCAVCGAVKDHRVHKVKEMTSGTRELFDYQECSECGFLELLNVPNDMSQYYASDYYSFGDQAPLKSWLKALRGARAFGSANPIGTVMAKIFGYPPIVHYLRRIDAKTSWKVLDVGCGQGIALRDLGKAGFSALHGVDPHLDGSKSIGSVQLIKKDFFEVTENYDLIIFNHSYEHMLNQKEALAHCAKILSQDGWLLIRMPIIGNSWRQYFVDWFCLHAPRHFSVHTKASFALQIQESKFDLIHCDFDSDWNHNLSSKKYQKDIPNSDPRYFAHGTLTGKDIADAKMEAATANEQGKGDQASFYLKIKGSRQALQSSST